MTSELKLQMGLVRFTEWVKEEGQPGSLGLLKYYKDVRAQAKLMEEVKVSTLRDDLGAYMLMG